MKVILMKCPCRWELAGDFKTNNMSSDEQQIELLKGIKNLMEQQLHAQVMPLMLTTKRVAQTLDMSVRTVERLVKAGELKPVTRNGIKRFRKADVLAYAGVRE
jgi:excisionase family DNA binding protein